MFCLLAGPKEKGPNKLQNQWTGLTICSHLSGFFLNPQNHLRNNGSIAFLNCRSLLSGSWRILWSKWVLFMQLMSLWGFTLFWGEPCPLPTARIFPCPSAATGLLLWEHFTHSVNLLSWREHWCSNSVLRTSFLRECSIWNWWESG